MAPLLVVLALFLAAGAAQALMAGRIVDVIHGGPGRREARARRLDVMVVRVAGGFVATVAAIALLVVALGWLG